MKRYKHVWSKVIVFYRASKMKNAESAAAPSKFIFFIFYFFFPSKAYQ